MPDADRIRTLCLSFPDVTEDMPWDDSLCFKVRGKIFVSLVLSDGRFPRTVFNARRRHSTNCWRSKASPSPPTLDATTV